MNSLIVPFILIAFLTFEKEVQAKCAFKVGPNNIPQKVDSQPFLLQGLTMCKQYNGKMGCCDEGNDKQQAGSYIQIDGVFGSMGDGCDVCAINLKRFWCEYACSPNQADFMKVQQGLHPMPDPQKPDNILYVQKLTLTVQAQTACDLYNSCKRISFVSSVSAMSSPAGFLTFQGHNAADDALQDIAVKFSYDKKQSLYFSNQEEQVQRKAMDKCNFTTQEPQLHGFQFSKNCTCNNCEDSCKDNEGFQYKESELFQGFNGTLVGGTWAFCIVAACLLTYKKSKSKKGKYQ